jgi:hypothetical protein
MMATHGYPPGVPLALVSNEQKAITKKRTTWYTEHGTSRKGTVSQRLLALTASFAMVEEGFLSSNYHISIVT